MFIYIFPIVVLYLYFSLIRPMKFRFCLLTLIMLPLIIGGTKLFALGLIWEGGSFIAPEAPRNVLIITSVCFSILVLMMMFTMLRDALRLLLLLISKMTGRSLPSLGGRVLFVTIYSASVFIALVGSYQSFLIPNVRESELVIDGLPAHLDGLKVVLLADIHATKLNDERYVRALVERSNAINADLILLPGDMIDGSVESRRKDVAPLADLQARLGVYLAFGNHEYYSGYHEWLAHFRSMGMNLLLNEHVRVTDGLIVAGVGDVTAGYQYEETASNNQEGVNFNKALAGVDVEKDTVLLIAHNPRLAKDAEAHGVDLMMAGHTHGGMMPVFAQFVIAPFNDGFLAGLYQLDKMQLYVSRGAGIWPGFILRFGVPSEISLLHLRSKKPSS